MGKIKIKYIDGYSLSYCIDAELFELQMLEIKLFIKIREVKGWTDFFLFQLKSIKTREAELNLLKRLYS